ncbi:BRO1-like domain-containing protein [Phlyctochytrium arcticum]|nr:BRO1-like domain-containing protein [Phlyctochytrium arcticum]
MSGVSSTNMLPVEFKRTERLSLAPPIKAYIGTAYAEDPDIYIDDFRNLDNLRGDIIILDVHTASLNKLLKYYGQLLYVGSKFPIDENNIKICFSWYNAIGKDTRKSISSFSLNFEKASILFNIAAMYSQLGVSENRSTAEGLKRAAIYLQQSAGVFETLQAQVPSMNLPTAPDFSPSALNTLSNFMLAQAQECFWYKAVVDKMKDAVIARLAAQVAMFYEQAHTNAVSSGVFHDSWLVQMDIKVHHFKAAAQFRQSQVCLAAGKYGEEIARLQAAIGHVKKALNSSSFKKTSSYVQSDLKNLQGTIEQALQRAEKDNDIVYMETVPHIETLQPIGGAKMVNATPLPDLSDLSDVVGPAMFSKLVPFSVHQSASVYSHKKDALVGMLIGKIAEASEVAQSTLSSLNLPAAIEALEQPIGLPPTLLKHSEEVRSQGGAKSLHDSWATITALSDRDVAILNQVVKTLDDEEADDEEMRRQFGPKWTRTRSAEHTGNLREGVKNYRKKLDAAKKSDLLIKSKMEDNLHYIESLSSSKEELEASIPSSTVQSTPVSKDPTVKQLKGLLDQLNGVIKARSSLTENLKRTAASDDIGPRLVEAANRSEGKEDDELFSQQLKRYEPFEQAAEKSLAEQATLLNAITETNRQFMSSKQSNHLIRDRENALQNLDNAYKAFVDISANMHEGVKFYTDFQAVLNRFADNCRQYALTRSVDKRDIINELQRSLTDLRVTDPSHNVGGGAPQLPPRQGGGGYNYGGGAGGAQFPTPSHMPPAGATWNPSMPLQYGPPKPQQQQQQQQNQQSSPYAPNVYYSNAQPSSMPPPMPAGQTYRPYGV